VGTSARRAGGSVGEWGEVTRQRWFAHNRCGKGGLPHRNSATSDWPGGPRRAGGLRKGVGQPFRLQSCRSPWRLPRILGYARLPDPDVDRAGGARR
jgi:hypothetical protein